MFRVSARTVLELGSELISSDIIAFYELIKNAFDAGSKTGAEVRFHIPLRRNDYLKLRARARAMHDDSLAAHLDSLRAELRAALDPTAGDDRLQGFAVPEGLSNGESFLAALDAAYGTLNTIEVLDTGCGMSPEELSENYLTIGTPSRRRLVDEAIRGGRTKPPFLGEKGIGRLAAMRLGERLLVETARTQDSRLASLEIDWRRFDDLDAFVEDISIEPALGGPKPTADWSGTRITIGGLSRHWSRAGIQTMVDHDFARLLDPFEDPKTRRRVVLSWNGSRLAMPWLQRGILDHAHATLRGTYSIDGGEPTLHCRLDAIDLGFEHPRDSETMTLSAPDIAAVISGVTEDIPGTTALTLGPFDFEAYWYNRRRLSRIDGIGELDAVRKLQKRWSGFMLFRDGFRVFPYGDDKDDWLGLDRRALGRPGYTLNKTQFIGRVRIGRTRNPELIDQTNREGLRSTPEEQAFVALLHYVIQDRLWDFLRQMDRYKHTPTSLDEVKTDVSELKERSNVALAQIRRLVGKENQSVVADLQRDLTESYDLVDRAQSRVEQVEEESRQMVHMAGVGLLVEVVAHELARSSENALKALERLRGKDLPAETRSHLDTLRSEMQSVSKRLRFLDQLSVSGRQRAEEFDLVALVEDLREGHTAQLARHGLRLEVKKPKKPIRVRAVKGMIIQILENLIANSVYWTGLRGKRESAYKPFIWVELKADPVTIYFSDNGTGVAPENHERVFRAFWSLKPAGKRRGLGLYIARECAQYLKGSLVLSDAKDRDTGRLHQFVLELPESASSP